MLGCEVSVALGPVSLVSFGVGVAFVAIVLGSVPNELFMFCLGCCPGL